MTITDRMAAWRRERRVLRRVSRAAWRLEQAERERSWALASVRTLAAAAGLSPARAHQITAGADLDGLDEEILGLDVDDLDLEGKTTTVTGKGGIPRQVNWYTHTARLLPRVIGGRTCGPLFLAGRRPRLPVATIDLDPATGRARLSYRRAAEVFTATTGWTLHQLRRTRIRGLKDNGCPLPVVQKITGHRSLRTLTEHYPGPSPETVRAWYDATDPAARRRRSGGQN